MKELHLFTSALLLPALTMSTTTTMAQNAQKPNIIYILADDLGIGDLSCYGQQKINTPNLDKLAAQGMKFTQFYTGAAVSAPSRSTLMTGLHTGHTPIRNNGKVPELKEGQNPIPKEIPTVAQVLKTVGYSTGAFGKWGLGYVGSEGDPNNKGFDEFFGYNCQTMAHRYYPEYLWHNSNKIKLDGNDWKHTVTYSADLIHSQAIKFVEEHKDKPFFLYYASTLPHAELLVPDDEILAEQKKKFAGESPYVNLNKGAAYGDDLIIKEYCSQKHPYATFASMVIRLDKHVGEIMDKIKELGLENNTIIMFASDNGPHRQGGANPEFFNSAAGLRGIKGDLFEGGIRTAMIAKWKGHIKPMSTSDHVSAFWDIMPTLAEIAGAQTPEKCDGISFLPTLLGKKQKQHDFLYWEFTSKGGVQAVRMGNWKGIREKMSDNPNAPIQIYNLALDPKESKNIAAEHPEIVTQINKIMKEQHVKSDLKLFKFKYELKNIKGKKNIKNNTDEHIQD